MALSKVSKNAASLTQFALSSTAEGALRASKEDLKTSQPRVLRRTRPSGLIPPLIPPLPNTSQTEPFRLLFYMRT